MSKTLIQTTCWLRATQDILGNKIYCLTNQSQKVYKWDGITKIPDDFIDPSLNIDLNDAVNMQKLFSTGSIDFYQTDDVFGAGVSVIMI